VRVLAIVDETEPATPPPSYRRLLARGVALDEQRDGVVVEHAGSPQSRPDDTDTRMLAWRASWPNVRGSESKLAEVAPAEPLRPGRLSGELHCMMWTIAIA
jgi:hypothetical protein